MGEWKTTHWFPTTWNSEIDSSYHYPIPQLGLYYFCIAGSLGGRAGSDTAPHAAGFARQWCDIGQAQLVEATLTMWRSWCKLQSRFLSQVILEASDMYRYVTCQIWRREALSCLQRPEDVGCHMGPGFEETKIEGWQHVTTKIEKFKVSKSTILQDPWTISTRWPYLMHSNVIKPMILHMHPERIWTYVGYFCVGLGLTWSKISNSRISFIFFQDCPLLYITIIYYNLLSHYQCHTGCPAARRARWPLPAQELCGHPQWGTATDDLSSIEGRAPWPPTCLDAETIQRFQVLVRKCAIY